MRITYEVITPESAEHGDAEERGFIEPKFKLRVPVEEALDESKWPAGSLDWTLREAELFLGRRGMEDSGTWFNSCDPERDFQTGAETFYSLHPTNQGGSITAASYARLRAIFC